MNKHRDRVQMAAIAYCRVSTEEQARAGVSLDAQAERLEAYCRVAGLELAQLVREEGVSGAKALDSRPGGKQLLSLVNWGKVQHVVALKLDSPSASRRISRDVHAPESTFGLYRYVQCSLTLF